MERLWTYIFKWKQKAAEKYLELSPFILQRHYEHVLSMYINKETGLKDIPTIHNDWREEGEFRVGEIIFLLQILPYYLKLWNCFNIKKNY